MKVYKNKISGNSKDNIKKGKATSNSPCLKYSFTEFPNESSNQKLNTLIKNNTSNHLQKITKKNIISMLSLTNSSNFKKKYKKTNSKINTESLFHEHSSLNLIKPKNKGKKNQLKNKSRMKPQKNIITMTNDFSFSNSIIPNNIEENKRNQRDIFKNLINHKHLRTNTFSYAHSNKNIINLKRNHIISKQMKYYNNSSKSSKRNLKNLTVQFNDLNEKLNNTIKENKNNRNKKYNSIQKIFEEIISILPEENKALFKNILIEIHDIVNEYYLELKNLKEEYELNKKKLISIEKAQIYNIKLLNQKDLEIENLKKKIFNTMSIQEQQIISKSTNSSILISLSTEKEKKKIKKKQTVFQNRIEEFNKKNIFDLNALYFYDKVIMKSEFDSIPKNNNGELIPPLDLDFEKIERKRKEELMKKLNEGNLSFIQKVALSFELN